MNDTAEMATDEALVLLGRLIVGGRLAEARLDAALAAVGLSLAKWQALRPLVEGGQPLSLGALAARLACVRSNVTQLVDRLEADGLVRRMPDPDDRRGVLARATEEGARRYRAGHAALGAARRALLAAYTPEEAEQLGALLARLTGEPG